MAVGNMIQVKVQVDVRSRDSGNACDPGANGFIQGAEVVCGLLSAFAVAPPMLAVRRALRIIVK